MPLPFSRPTLFIALFVTFSVQIVPPASSSTQQKKWDSAGYCMNCTICQYPCQAQQPPPLLPPPPRPIIYASPPPPPPSSSQGPGGCPPGSVPCCQYPTAPGPPTAWPYGQNVPPSPYTLVPYNNFSACAQTLNLVGQAYFLSVFNFFLYFSLSLF